MLLPPKAIGRKRGLPTVIDHVPAAGKAMVDFTSGTDGQTRYAWARYDTNVMGTFGDMWGGGIMPGSRTVRESVTAAAVATDLHTSNPTIATLVENLTTNALGTGLTFSSKPDAEALGITPDDARALSRSIERKWAAWAANPKEVDLAGRHDLHALASAAFKSFILAGEVVTTVNWLACPDALTRTKVAVLDARQLDRTKGGSTQDGGIVQGVQFNPHGRVTGYWLRTFVAGQMSTPMSKLVPATTPWGRTKVVHLYDLVLPGQVRGLSPLVAALTPAHEKNTLAEFTTSGAVNQAAMTITVESDLPPAVALRGLDADPVKIDELMTGRADWYSATKIDPKPGTINHLAPGDKLKFNRVETPNSVFDSFDKSLDRKAAKAAGSSYEDVSGDYSKTSFSASRMATELPHRINLRRRKLILERFYSEVFGAWLEEAIETGAIVLPKGAPEFWRARAAYCNGRWMGLGRVQPDPKKAAEADLLELENGLATLSDKLAERGMDLEESIAMRKHEKALLKEAGLVGHSPYSCNIVTQNRIEEKEDDE